MGGSSRRDTPHYPMLRASGTMRVEKARGRPEIMGHGGRHHRVLLRPGPIPTQLTTGDSYVQRDCLSSLRRHRNRRSSSADSSGRCASPGRLQAIKMDVSGRRQRLRRRRPEIPGVAKDDIQVSIEGSQVTIGAEVKRETETEGRRARASHRALQRQRRTAASRFRSKSTRPRATLSTRTACSSSRY